MHVRGKKFNYFRLVSKCQASRLKANAVCSPPTIFNGRFAVLVIVLNSQVTVIIHKAILSNYNFQVYTMDCILFTNV